MSGFKDPWSDDQKQGESLRRATSQLEDKLLVGDKMLSKRQFASILQLFMHTLKVS